MYILKAMKNLFKKYSNLKNQNVIKLFKIQTVCIIPLNEIKIPYGVLSTQNFARKQIFKKFKFQKYKFSEKFHGYP